MATLTAAAPSGKGRVEISDETLGKGGEGSVYNVTTIDSSLDFLPDADDLVAKIYHDGHGEAGKIRAMLLSPPDSDAVAWPVAALFAERKFSGFLMKKLDFENNRPWSDLAHSGTRRKTAQDFDVSYAITAIRNFAVALSDVHDAGHMVGDINESNMFVANNAQVYLVDTDSAQISDPKTGDIFKCLVGKPEYTAAEISHGKLKEHTRTPETEVFGFAIAAYQMLLGGPHPSDAVYKGKDDPPSVIEKIRQGIFPGLQGKQGKFSTPQRIAVNGIPSSLREIILQSLNPDPEKRPSTDELIDVFDEVSDNLVQCSKVKQHWYDQRDKKCGWCQHAEHTGIDPWTPEQKPTGIGPGAKNPAGRKQRQMSSLNYESGDNNASDPPKRLPPQRAGQNNQVQPQQAPYANNGHTGAPQGYGQQNMPPNAQQGYQNYPPQGHPGYPGYPPPQPPEPPTQKELKKQFKTSKTVLSYANGTYGVRPPIGELMRAKPKLAFSCIRDETPGFAAFWWASRKAVPFWWALLIGLIIAGGFASLWWMQMPGWLDLAFDAAGWEWDWLEYVKSVMAWTSVIGVAVTSVWMTASGLLEDARYLKKYKTLANINKENWMITILRYISISIIWGPILMVGTVVLSIVLVFNLIFAVVKSESGRR